MFLIGRTRGIEPDDPKVIVDKELQKRTGRFPLPIIPRALSVRLSDTVPLPVERRTRRQQLPIYAVQRPGTLQLHLPPSLGLLSQPGRIHELLLRDNGRPRQTHTTSDFWVVFGGRRKMREGFSGCGVLYGVAGSMVCVLGPVGEVLVASA